MKLASGRERRQLVLLRKADSRRAGGRNDAVLVQSRRHDVDKVGARDGVLVS